VAAILVPHKSRTNLSKNKSRANLSRNRGDKFLLRQCLSCPTDNQKLWNCKNYEPLLLCHQHHSEISHPGYCGNHNVYVFVGKDKKELRFNPVKTQSICWLPDVRRGGVCIIWGIGSLWEYFQRYVVSYFLFRYSAWE
jgi:hypothetical protein